MKRQEVFWGIIKDGKKRHRDDILKKMNDQFNGQQSCNPSMFSIYAGLLIVMGLLKKDGKMFQYVGK
jgi:hypothetical protein